MMKSSHILVQNHLYKSSPQGQLSHEHVGNSFAFTVAAQCICTAVYLTQSSNACFHIFDKQFKTAVNLSRGVLCRKVQLQHACLQELKDYTEEKFLTFDVT